MNFFYLKSCVCKQFFHNHNRNEAISSLWSPLPSKVRFPPPFSPPPPFSLHLFQCLLYALYLSHCCAPRGLFNRKKTKKEFPVSEQTIKRREGRNLRGTKGSWLQYVHHFCHATECSRLPVRRNRYAGAGGMKRALAQLDRIGLHVIPRHHQQDPPTSTVTFISNDFIANRSNL